jgi:ubiquinone/menaquinone biosynthesis C-methylase UbiE
MIDSKNNTILDLNCFLGEDGIWSAKSLSMDAMHISPEYKFRKNVEKKWNGEDKNKYLDNISKFYSIDVMDAEVSKVVKLLPCNAWIVDIGGNWGWHWRELKGQRPDVSVIIIDFVREGLINAKKILGDEVNQTIFLLHADACQIPIDDCKVDLVWSVQCFQHIEDIDRVTLESKRILKNNSYLRIYNFNYRMLEKIIYMMLGKKYRASQKFSNYYLRRFNDKIDAKISMLFGIKPSVEYTEVIFQPNFNILYKPGSILSKIDVFLSGGHLFKSIARQRTTIVKKINSKQQEI